MIKIKPNSAIQHYDNCLPPEICQEIIDGFEREVGKSVHSSRVDDRVDTYARDSQQIHLNPQNVRTIFGERAEALTQAVNEAMSYATQEYDGDLSGMLTRLVSWDYSQIDILKYDQALGNYKTHIDTDGRQGMERLFSIILYLNTVTFGGETVFPLQDEIVEPVRGRVVVFPSNFAFPHKACTPVSGDKYVLVGWTKALHNLT
jgi:hypothetical protein